MQTVVKDDIEALNTALKGCIGEHKHRVWFKNSTKMSLDGDCLKIGVANMFMSNWLEKHFRDDIIEAVQSVTGQKCRISFSIIPGLAGKTGKSPAFHQVKTSDKAGVTKRLKSSAKRLKLGLDSFVVGRCNQLAYNAARSIVSSDKSLYNPLFFHGGYGIGKTHLLQGVCNELSKARPQASWIYVSAEDFTNQFIMSMKTNKLETFRNRFRNADLLAIDDIHFLANKASTQEEFLHTFNSIDLAGKQIVLASDAHPKMIGQLCDKLVNRFVSGMVIKIDSPDSKTRYRICQNRLSAIGKSLPDSAVKYLAENIKANVRELEGAILKLIAFSSLNGGKISLPEVRNLLSEHISRTDPIVHISDIESVVAEFFSTTTTDIHSAKKDRTVSTARSFAMYLVRKYTKMSYPEIGKVMGKKNHATVILACRKVDGMLGGNLEVSWKIASGNRIMKARDIISKLEGAIG